jgi:hypothetical protein
VFVSVLVIQPTLRLVHVKKHFIFFVTYEWAHQVRVFISFRLFQPNLMLKVRLYSASLWDAILKNTSFSSKLMDRPNKLAYFIRID